jgi:hypothetical protein
MAALDQQLPEELSPTDQLVIIDRLWRKDIQDDDLKYYSAFLDYYTAQTKLLKKGILRSARLIDHIASKTHNDLLKMVEVLANNRDRSLATIRQLIQALFPRNAPYSELEIKHSIDLAVRIWLMLNVRDANFKLHTPNTPTIQWEGESESLNL